MREQDNKERQEMWMTEAHRTVQDRKCQNTRKNSMKADDLRSKKEGKDRLNER